MNQQTAHPKGLYLLFFTELWERFSYYGMRAILVLFLTKQLLMDKSFSSEIYGSFTGLVYLTPIIGGYLADRYWGNRKSIIIGGLLMAIGQFFLFFSGELSNHFIMYLGLGFLVFGNGFFKPNISTMVGQLYPENDRRLDSAYTIFYMGINLGAFIAPLICGWLGENIAFKWGFFAAGVGMLISVASFQWLKNTYLVSPEGIQIGVEPNKARLKEGESTVSSQLDNKQLMVIILGSAA
jgi:proton-dependent oligopeptide transporter, POT family